MRDDCGKGKKYLLLGCGKVLDFTEYSKIWGTGRVRKVSGIQRKNQNRKTDVVCTH